MTIEQITSLDEAKLLGYFETIKSVFLLKLILLTSVLKTDSSGRYHIETKNIRDAIKQVKAIIDDALFYKALAQGNEELALNLRDDVLTSLLMTSWIVFEQVTKDLVRADYATETEELSVCYQNKRFQFGGREKKDIELFYYIRNAIAHYNGAYFASKAIDHRYAGSDFKSIGHHGEKIDINIKVAWQIASDLERYTIKAWSNTKTFAPAPKKSKRP